MSSFGLTSVEEVPDVLDLPLGGGVQQVDVVGERQRHVTVRYVGRTPLGTEGGPVICC